MADVTGRIGNEEVEFTNAATEATLKMLLQATLAAAKGSKEELAKVAAMAARAGLDSDSIEKANEAVAQTTPGMNLLGRSAYAVGAAFGAVETDLRELAALTQKLTNGTAQASDVFGTMSRTLPGPLGLVASGFQQVALYQEGLLKTYRDLASSGMSFGGSLTDMKLAATGAYMNLQEFGGLLKRNSQDVARFGGSANGGVKEFSRLAAELQGSEIGGNLRALGLTAEQSNEAMIGYVANTGGRSKLELQNTQQILKGTSDYVEQLDRLSQLTGKSRQELEAQQKAKQREFDIEMTKARMSVEDRDAFDAALQEAEALMGDAGKDLVLARAQGREVTGDAGKLMKATSGQAAATVENLQQIAKTYGRNSTEFKEASDKARLQMQEGLGQIPVTVMSTNKSFALLKDGITRSAKDMQAGLTDETAMREARREQEAELAARKAKDAEVRAAADTESEIRRLGDEIMKNIAPILKTLMNWTNETIQFLIKYKEVTLGVVGALVVFKGALTAKALLDKLKGGGGGIPGVPEIMGPPRPGAPGVPGGTGPAGGGGLLSGMGSGLRAAAGGLRAFANPMVLAGAAGFGLAIAAIGAGIAGAAWLMGKALPTLAEGFMKFTEIDGSKLGASAFGIGKLGLGLIPFAPMAVWGIPAGFALNSLGDGLIKISSVDPVKLEKVAAGMEKIKAATPTVGESIKAGIAGLVSKVVGPSEPPAAPAPAKAPAAPAPAASGSTPGTTPAGTEQINVGTELSRLNSISSDMLRVLKETAENTKRNVEATNGLGGNLFKF